MAYPFIEWPGADGLTEASMHAWWFDGRPLPLANPPRPPSSPLEGILASWPRQPREVFLETVRRHGPPDEAAATHMVWHRRKPWERTVLYARGIPHNWPRPHMDILEQTIMYPVPVGAFSPLAEFDGSVIAERTKGSLSARCDNEEMNFLAVNLAHDVAVGARSPADARAYYEDAVRRLMTRGERDPYLRGLLFAPPAGPTGDPDVAAAAPEEGGGRRMSGPVFCLPGYMPVPTGVPGQSRCVFFSPPSAMIGPSPQATVSTPGNVGFPQTRSYPVSAFWGWKKD